MGWVSKDKYLETSGLTKGVLRGWFDRYLRKGIHYQVIGHTTLINVEEIEEWISQQALTDTGRGSASASTGKERLSTPKHSPAVAALDTSRQL